MDIHPSIHRHEAASPSPPLGLAALVFPDPTPTASFYKTQPNFINFTMGLIGCLLSSGWLVSLSQAEPNQVK
jgi:hypothetical protein